VRVSSGALAAAEAELEGQLGDTGDLARWLTRLADALGPPQAAECPAVG
jgi:hypothetical protein